MKPRRLIVLGTVGSNPFPGMAWMHMQIAAGLKRLGHEVYYFETTSAWPYNPSCKRRLDNSDYAISFLTQVVEQFGLGDCWAYRRSYSDKAWFGMDKGAAEELLAHADAVLNITGATRLAEEGLVAGRLILVGTDPVFHEIGYMKNDPAIRSLIQEHDDIVTYGENIGNPDCPIPALPRLRAKMRQPILLDMWEEQAPPRKVFTTICNWKQDGRDIEFLGETYYWSKHHEFLKFLDLPQRSAQPVELAMNLSDPESIKPGVSEAVRAPGAQSDERSLLRTMGWQLVDTRGLNDDLSLYRKYISTSRAEFTVAKDQNVRLKTGWFSERSACYLAAGRPVITQDTGFGKFIPTGRGLFEFNTMDDILTAFEAINSDYDKHARAAREIASEYFKAETVLARLLADLGL